jgi:DNA-binding beta-propeller fold protein YncE
MAGCYGKGMWSARERLAVVLATAAVVAVVLAVAVGTLWSPEATPNSGRSPTRVTAHSSVTQHFEYVISAGAVYVYSIDHGNRLVQTIRLSMIGSSIHGVVASPRTGRLFISYGLQRPPGGSLLAYDLRRGRVLWHRKYRFGVDSMAISQNGRRIYMPAGEATTSGAWRIIATSSGEPTGRVINGPAGAHNTIIGPDGRSLYLGGVDYPYLEVASTATNQVVRKLGPLNPPGVRPFTINGSQTLAFTTARRFLGFQVSSIQTGDVLYTVGIPGFSFDPATFGRTPDHGISLSPDERQLYLIDTPNGYVHVFDVSQLPATRPRLVADIKLRHAPPNDGWLQHSSNGRYVYVGRSGDVIDTRKRKIVAYLRPLRATADFLEIDWRHGRPVATTNRYGVGYRSDAAAG